VAPYLLTNTLCLRLDRRLTGLAAKLGWRYSRYADDLTFSLPESHKGKPRLGSLLGSTRRIVEDEGFRLHPKKTRVSRKGARQKITGLIVNGRQAPRTPRQLRRMIRAAVHNATQGKPPHEGETIHTIEGYAAYIAATQPELGLELLKQLAEIEE
jgi:retron-type reverse transcriptase